MILCPSLPKVWLQNQRCCLHFRLCYSGEMFSWPSRRVGILGALLPRTFIIGWVDDYWRHSRYLQSSRLPVPARKCCWMAVQTLPKNYCETWKHLHCVPFEPMKQLCLFWGSFGGFGSCSQILPLCICQIYREPELGKADIHAYFIQPSYLMPLYTISSA